MAPTTPGTVAIFPGSFDPVTNGHLDLIERSALLFGKLIVAVLRNRAKQPLFTAEERQAMLREVTAGIPNVTIDAFDGLLIEYAAHYHATAIVRGIRAVSDYESELQMAHLNRRMRPATETIFLPASAENSFISSRMIKEIIELQGDVRPFVPPAVLKHLNGKGGKPLK